MVSRPFKICSLWCGIIISSLILLQSIHASPAPWGWRKDGTGIFPDADPPTQWSTNLNVVWKTRLPKWSNASPVLAGDRIIVCAEPASLFCLNGKDGTILWQKSNLPDEVLSPEELAQSKTAKLSPPHNANGFTSATPFFDGKRIYVLFDTGVVAAYDLKGQRLWSRWIEPSKVTWGHCASPIVVGSSLIITIDGIKGLDTLTGKTLWQKSAPNRWGSPIRTDPSGHRPLVATANGMLLDPTDGRLLAQVPASLTYCAAISSGDRVFFIENGGAAYRFSSSSKTGDYTGQLLWKTQPPAERYYASPLLDNGLIYAIMQYGTLSVIDSETGGLAYSQKVPLTGTSYPSITKAGPYIFISSEGGTTVVIKPGRTYVQVAANKLESFRTTPVFEGSRMYIRTFDHLYCIGR